MILRDDLPEGTVNPDGSIKLEVLGQAGFRYLDYEENPLQPIDAMVLDADGASKALMGAVGWVAQAARDVYEEVLYAINEIDQLFHGDVTVNVWVHALTRDELFKDDVLRRGWGKYAGKPIGASGMQVKILQKMIGLHIPTVAKDDANINGKAVLDVTEGAMRRGRGLCIELKTKAALITSHIIAKEICDLRAYDAEKTPNGSVDDFHLAKKFTEDTTIRVHADHFKLLGLYQADDVYRYSRQVMDYKPQRARILTGRWAETFTVEDSDGNFEIPFAACQNFSNRLTEAIANANIFSDPAGTGRDILLPMANLPEKAVSAARAALAFVLANADIMLPPHSKIRLSRGIMSHEYGHFMFCNMVHDANPDAVDHLIWATIMSKAESEELDVPLRYVNETMAEFFLGQVASGADYQWLAQAEINPDTRIHDRYCSDRATPCWDDNLRADSAYRESIGRLATLLMDVFDGQSAGRTASVPTDGDAWRWDASINALVYNSSPNGDGVDDSALERVALPGSSLRTIASVLADGLEPFIEYDVGEGFEASGDVINDQKFREAVNTAMEDAGESWCDRCRVLALHEPNGSIGNVRELWQTCLADGDLLSLLGPGPDSESLRLRASTCELCPDGYYSDANGDCRLCHDTLVGNDCVVCQPDQIIDGATADLTSHVFNVTSTSLATDNCPEAFWVQVLNAGEFFGRGADSVVGVVGPNTNTEAACEQPFSLTTHLVTPAGLVVKDVISGAGRLTTACDESIGQCLDICLGTPARLITQSEAANTVWFSSPVLPGVNLSVEVSEEPWAG